MASNRVGARSRWSPRLAHSRFRPRQSVRSKAMLLGSRRPQGRRFHLAELLERASLPAACRDLRTSKTRAFAAEQQLEIRCIDFSITLEFKPMLLNRSSTRSGPHRGGGNRLRAVAPETMSSSRATPARARPDRRDGPKRYAASSTRSQARRASRSSRDQSQRLALATAERAGQLKNSAPARAAMARTLAQGRGLWTSATSSSDPRRHRRRRSGPVRWRSFPNVRAQCAKQGWKVEINLGKRRSELGGYKEITQESEDRGLREAQVRKRRPSRAARARDRGAGPHPHFGRDRGRAAGAGRVRNRHQGRRLADRYFFAAAPAASTSTRPNSRSRLTHIPTGIVVNVQDESSSTRISPRRCACCMPRLYESSARSSDPSAPPSASARSARATAASEFAPTTFRKTA